MQTDYSPELGALCTWENLLERSRISEAGRLAESCAASGYADAAGHFARQAAHQARICFPNLFLWDSERYGQQLPLEAA